MIGIALFALDGHKKRQRKMTNAFIIKKKKTKWDHHKA
jgi:hypothetical protein